MRPEPEWTHWDASAEAVHHISRHSLLQHGRSPQQIAEALNRELAGKVVYSDGWANDYSWIALLFDAAERVPAFRLDSLRTLLSEEQANRWHDTKAQVEAELHIERHRASNDARVLQLTLQRLRHGLQPLGESGRSHEAHLLDEMARLDQLTLGDLIAAQHGQFSQDIQREHHAAALACGGRVIAEHLQQRLAGYVLLRPRAEHCWEILAINIHPWYRSTGLHRRLLTRTLAHLISHGADTLHSVVLPGHELAIKMHEKLGFAREADGTGQVRFIIRVPDLARRLRQA
ncbi:GNAT family N-acetyltransferase [Niveibacterium sp. 24ML]|uniref:GNAT family N-acetyltransferase n=1 Tax=Niveibacterium sp. 24ML TaxID=2985512 RepID=UPI00227124FF|nr:GNAT family N-acetyltransferase [Niveibacterium sp. 24ML]MCX9158068.1 GNAT family N-acetyltransferase [Niveibacterium sp. 24ML]